jgi:hypothetical protein
MLLEEVSKASPDSGANEEEKDEVNDTLAEVNEKENTTTADENKKEYALAKARSKS